MLSISLQELFKGLYRRCACGCGYLIRIVGKSNKIRSYKQWHQPQGEKSPFYIGKGKSMGYETTNVYNHPYYSYRQVHTHRLIMSEYLGRKLESWEHIHHKDGNKFNNDISNLELLTDREHGIISGNAKRVKDLGQKCSDLKCPHPDKTTTLPSGSPKWYKNDKGNWLCKTCYDRQRRWKKKL